MHQAAAPAVTSRRRRKSRRRLYIGLGIGGLIFLLVVGSIIEIFSSLIVVVPLIVPLAVEYDVDLVQLGIIFLTNLEVGYLLPPVGLNLFVTSGITGMSIARVVRAALPWSLVLLVFLMIVTYLPAITLWLPRLMF